MEASTSGRTMDVAPASDAEVAVAVASSSGVEVQATTTNTRQCRTGPSTGPAGWRMDSKQSLDTTRPDGGALELEFAPPKPDWSLGEWVREQLDSASQLFAASKAARQFLHAIKQGDTAGALDCLANHHFLLAHHKFAQGGDTVWHLLAEYGDIGLLQALTNFCKIHSLPKRYQTPKYMPNGVSDRDALIYSFVNAGNNLKQTPLMFAAYHGRDEVIRFLLQMGADPWAPDRCGRRAALHYAALRGHASCVHTLLDCIKPEHKERDGTAYTDVRSASGFTPLHFAVACNSSQVVRALLSFDACIDAFNVFDAGEFWLSCVNKSTPLHLAAISNRLYCAGAILQYWDSKKAALHLEDPRGWRDKKGRLPVEIAAAKGYTELERVLAPGSDMRPLIQFMPGLPGGSVVIKLQAIAAKAVQAQLLASIQEAEEFMKLLGTYQQHGRVFARLAYDSSKADQVRQQASHGSFMDEARMQESMGMMGRPSGHYDGQAGMASVQFSMHERRSSIGPGQSRNGHSGDSLNNSMQLSGQLGGLGGQQQRSGESNNHAGLGALRHGGVQPVRAMPRANRQAALKQWLSYERKAVEAGLRPARKQPMQERSILSQRHPDDAESCTGCIALLTGKRVYLPPQPGEDVCGLCQDNKPLLQMQPCGHRTCLLCAKSMCDMLDLQKQLVLCPYCGSVVASFGLA